MGVEYLYGDTNLCKLEVQSIFAILVSSVRRTQSNIDNGAFCKNDYLKYWQKSSHVDVPLVTKYASAIFQFV